MKSWIARAIHIISKGTRSFPKQRYLQLRMSIEAMASDRAQRPAMDVDSIMEEITAQRGVLYDPDVVDVSLRLLTEKKVVL